MKDLPVPVLKYWNNAKNNGILSHRTFKYYFKMSQKSKIPSFVKDHPDLLVLLHSWIVDKGYLRNHFVVFFLNGAWIGFNLKILSLTWVSPLLVSYTSCDRFNSFKDSYILSLNSANSMKTFRKNSNGLLKSKFFPGTRVTKRKLFSIWFYSDCGKCVPGTGLMNIQVGNG